MQGKEKPPAGDAAKGAMGSTIINKPSAERDCEQANVFCELADLSIWLPHSKSKAPQYLNDLGVFIGDDWDKPQHWMKLDRALAIVEANPALLTGVGLVICKSTVIHGMRLNAIDVDLIDGYHKADPVRGIEAVIFDPATDADKVRGIVSLIDRIDTYWEAGPSRTGVHAYLWVPEDWAVRYANTGKFYPGGCHHAEYYTGEKPTYITVTFDPLGACNPLGVLSDAVQVQLGPMLTPVDAKADMPPTSVGTPIRLDDYGLPDDQAALVAGTLPKGKRSEGMHGLTVGLLDDGHSRDDVLATLHEEPNLAEYFTSKHPGDPAKFALAELEKAWAKSWQGILARLAPYNSAWAQPDAVTIRAFAGIPVLNKKAQAAVRFDAKATTLDELDAEDPPQQYVIEPIYPLGVPGEFAGAHGIGKSINGAEQCCCVATGRDWQGLSVTQGKAVFASWEDPRPQIMRRVKTWLRNIADPLEHAKAKRAIAENLVVLGCDEIDLMLTAKAFGVCSVRDEVIELIAESCQGAMLVMLETAALMHGGDELNEDLAQLAKAVKLITKATGAAVITVRHVSKDAARNKVVDAYVGRGGGSFTGAMRTMVVLVDVPVEDVRKKCIGFGNAAVVTGRPVLAYHHVKANYGDKMKEPVYLAVMPDGHMQRVAGPDERQAHSDRLLEWLRDNVPPEGMSYTKIRGASKKHGAKQDMVRVMLEMLKSAGHITNRQVSCQGGKGTAETWYLTEQV